jgi:hypothetical protein
MRDATDTVHSAMYIADTPAMAAPLIGAAALAASEIELDIGDMIVYQVERPSGNYNVLI